MQQPSDEEVGVKPVKLPDTRLLTSIRGLLAQGFSARSSTHRMRSTPPWAHGSGTGAWLFPVSPFELIRPRTQHPHRASAVTGSLSPRN